MPPEVMGASLADAVRRAIDILIQSQSALVTDVDGTISRIVARPEDAVVSERARQALAGLSEKLHLLAVVTAREADTARNMVGLDGLSYVGNYALDAAARNRMNEEGLERLKTQASLLIDRLPCVTMEEKGISFALHYRNCPEPETTRLHLLGALEPLLSEAGARLLEGKRVVEAVPASLPDKGVAVSNLANEHDIRGLVYLGDDVADVAVFREIALRRQKGQPGLGIAVIDAETDASVRDAADLTLEGVDAVEDFLAALLQEMNEAGP